MMLRGEKPLAMFTDGEGRFPDSVLRYLRCFDRQVADGKMVRRDHLTPDWIQPPRVKAWRTIYYALPKEEWRIDAMIELRDYDDWTIEKERQEGYLLGYEDWQMEIWLRRFRK